MVKRREDIAEGHAVDSSAWMVTFSDLIMLLLTFFVLLLSMSSMDRRKLKEIILHVKEAAGLLEFSGSRGITDLATFIKRHRKEKETYFMIDRDLLRYLFMPSMESDRKMEEIIDLIDDERGIVISFQEDIMFDPGEATLKKEAFPVLDSIARAIGSSPNDILIMGHTDNVPVQSKLYESKWDLSSYRGLSVLEYFLKEKGLLPSRFSVGGYGPSRPLYPNDTPENRALNRRIEIIFKSLQGV
jgi:chemotaxis protein MotB